MQRFTAGRHAAVSPLYPSAVAAVAPLVVVVVQRCKRLFMVFETENSNFSHEHGQR